MEDIEKIKTIKTLAALYEELLGEALHDQNYTRAEWLFDQFERALLRTFNYKKISNNPFQRPANIPQSGCHTGA